MTTEDVISKDRQVVKNNAKTESEILAPPGRVQFFRHIASPPLYVRGWWVTEQCGHFLWPLRIQAGLIFSLLAQGSVTSVPAADASAPPLS